MRQVSAIVGKSLFLVALLWTAPQLLADARTYYIPSMPKDLSRFEVSLVTVGYESELYQLWGHTALRLTDPDSRTDVTANWGFFDFEAPNFGLNFFRGILTYRFGFQSYDDMLKTYVYEGRSVWVDKLSLTPLQKEKLMQKIIWNAQPENRSYQYMYFFDNCSTRLRDNLDEAMGGAFRERFGKGLTDLSFRDIVRRHMAPQPFFGMSLDVLMNDRLDRPVSLWEEMFLPLPLRQYLLQMPAIDDGGKPRLGEALVSESKQVLSYTGPVTPNYNGFHLVVIPFAILLCISLALGGITGTSEQKPSSRKENWFRRAIGAVGVLWGGLFGTFGVIMLVAWIASAHLDLHHNSNLWIFWPTDILLLWFAAKWLIFGTKRPISPRLKGILRIYSALHLLGFMVLVSFTFLGVFHQDTRLVTSYFGPPMVFFWGLVFRKIAMDPVIATRAVRLHPHGDQA